MGNRGRIFREGKHALVRGEAFVWRGEPYWPAQAAVAAAIVLYLTLPEKLVFGPRFLIPALEGALLVGLAITTPYRTGDMSPLRRRAAIALIAIVNAANAGALVLLVHYLLKGGKANGRELIVSSIVIWVTNVLIFALWYWESDGSGPGERKPERTHERDFLFPQMSQPDLAPEGWIPDFGDYLYVSFTNATAFSPTDTMPLTPLAKMLMLVQSLVSLLTVVLVGARAVNILS